MFKNLKELVTSMPDEESCRKYFAQYRWEGGKPVCPYCNCDRCYVCDNGKRYKCGGKGCNRKFSVTVNTIFHASNVPLSKWFMAIYLITAHKKGISSYQLAKDIGISQKSAWFVLHRARELMKRTSTTKLTGIIEADETYMARKYRSDYKGTVSEQEIEYNLKNKYKSKGAVVALAQRGGEIIVKAFDENNAKIIRENIKTNVEAGSELYTDESKLYKAGLEEYTRKSILHSKRQWCVEGVHVNNVENFWSVMKRGVHGIYHQISFKHLQRYCSEYSYRYNTRQIKDHERFIISLSKSICRLDYKTLTGKDKNLVP